MWILLVIAATAVALLGAVAGWAALTLISGLAGLLVLGLSPAMAGRRLPRAGLILLGLDLVVEVLVVPGSGEHWARNQFTRDVVVAVLVTAACAALFSGTWLGGKAAVGGLLFTVLVIGAIATAVESWRRMNDLGEHMGAAVEGNGPALPLIPIVVVAAALLVFARRREPWARRSQDGFDGR
ncbi:hypothetical protein AB0F72_19895 [Actinoplanes sp. NPDC023936]|uniref:hypothetical protein n=1 Tax=Actinoplanes sp. NPDC023936 TaxID=3154910 RepID=UPI0033C5F8C7